MAEIETRRRPEPRPPIFRQPASDAPDGARLSAREIQALQMLVAHGSVKAAAQALSMSEFTMKNHLTSVYAKLEVRCRAGAVVEAFRRGLIRL